MARITQDILSAWDEYVEPLHATDLFKQWGGVSLLSAILTRRVWFQTNPVMPPLYPNLFILLCGLPGSGKDLIINTVRRLLNMAMEGMEQGKGVCIGPESISCKGLIDQLADDVAELSFTYKPAKGKPKTVKYQSLFVANGELGAFMPEYNTQLVGVICDLYNCKDSYTDRVRGRGLSSQVKIDNPHLAMLLGTQPALFAKILPEEAFQMGFTARLNIVHSRQVVRRPMFADNIKPTQLGNYIASDLRTIAMQLTGEYKPTPSFKQLFNEFHQTNPNKIEHSRFEDYNSRRSLHLGKLAMICAASESNELMLTDKHIERALKYLESSEKTAPSLFDNLVTSAGFHHTIEQALNTEEKTITLAQLERKLRRTHRPHEVGHIIRSMEDAHDIVFLRHEGTMKVYKINKQTKELDI